MKSIKESNACLGVECSRCGSEIGIRCRTKNGSIRRSRPHQERKNAWAIRYWKW